MASPPATTPEPAGIFLSFLRRDEVLQLLMLGLEAVTEGNEVQNAERQWQVAMERFAPTQVAVRARREAALNR